MEITKKIISDNKTNPELLENLYQENKKIFSEIIREMYEQEPDLIIKYWYFRLFFKPQNKKSNIKKYLFTAFLVILIWIPIRLALTEFFEDNIYLIKWIPVISSIALSLFFLFSHFKIKNIVLAILPNIILYIYLILLPVKDGSQSLDNAFYFTFVLLWFFILFTYSAFKIKKLDFTGFLEQVGEVIVWSTIFIIGGAIVVGLSLALFAAIKIDAFTFYLKNIVTLGLTASPFVSLLVIANSNKTKLSVILANIFLPLILFSLVTFGIFSLFTETKPYEDRNIFITYNLMMVIVICVLVFTSINSINNKIITVCAYILPIVAIVLDIITISAIIYRLSEYGITPNKITLLGTNLIMLGHLVYILIVKFKKKTGENVKYLPLYFIWAFIVVFVLPFVFKMA